MNHAFTGMSHIKSDFLLTIYAHVNGFIYWPVLHSAFKAAGHKCYAMKHIKMLPRDGKENQPRRINYVEQYNSLLDSLIYVQCQDLPKRFGTKSTLC